MAKCRKWGRGEEDNPNVSSRRQVLKLKIRVVLLSDEIEGIYGPTVLHGGCLRKR